MTLFDNSCVAPRRVSLSSDGLINVRPEETTSFIDSTVVLPVHRIMQVQLPLYHDLYPSGSDLHPPTYDGNPRPIQSPEDAHCSWNNRVISESHSLNTYFGYFDGAPTLWKAFSASCFIWWMFGIGFGTMAILSPWLTASIELSAPLYTIAAAKLISPVFLLLNLFPKLRQSLATRVALLHILLGVCLLSVATYQLLYSTEDPTDLPEIRKKFAMSGCYYSEGEGRVQCSTWLNSLRINRMLGSAIPEDLKLLPQSLPSLHTFLFASYMKDYYILCFLSVASIVFSVLVLVVLVVVPSL